MLLLLLIGVMGIVSMSLCVVVAWVLIVLWCCMWVLVTILVRLVVLVGAVWLLGVSGLGMAIARRWSVRAGRVLVLVA